MLRRKPPGKLLPSAHAVDREYRVITALVQSGVPVPRTWAFCADQAVIGTPFYVMDYVRGRIFSDPFLPGVGRGERAAIYDAMNHVLARLHALDWRAVGLADFAQKKNLCLMTTMQLLCIYRDLESGRLSSADLLDNILSTTGRLPGFALEEEYAEPAAV